MRAHSFNMITFVCLAAYLLYTCQNALINFTQRMKYFSHLIAFIACFWKSSYRRFSNFFSLVSSSFFQPELYLCTPIKVDYTSDYYIGESSERKILLNCVCRSSAVFPFILATTKGHKYLPKRLKNGFYEIWISVGCGCIASQAQFRFCLTYFTCSLESNHDFHVFVFLFHSGIRTKRHNEHGSSYFAVRLRWTRRR